MGKQKAATGSEQAPLAGELSNPLWMAYARCRTKRNRNALVTQYLPLAAQIAKRVHTGVPCFVGLEVLASAANVGLIQAVERFDAAKRTLFPAFATPVIRGAVLDELRRQDHLSRNTRKTQKARQDVTERLRAAMLCEPTQQEIDEGGGAGPGAKATPPPPPQIYSLDRPVCAGADADQQRKPMLLADAMPDRMEALPQDQLDFLDRATRGFPLLHRFCVYLYFYRGLTMRQISWVLDISESRVSQQVAESLDWLGRRWATSRDARNELLDSL
jgi:RNA polymerase sigma factor FliA